jgi:hypothetical protein
MATSYLEATIDIFPTFGSSRDLETAVTFTEVKGSMLAFLEVNNVEHNLILENGEILIFENGIPLDI